MLGSGQGPGAAAGAAARAPAGPPQNPGTAASEQKETPSWRQIGEVWVSWQDQGGGTNNASECSPVSSGVIFLPQIPKLRTVDVWP
jgi:hypothetical protein